jgi:cytochrome c556
LSLWLLVFRGRVRRRPRKKPDGLSKVMVEKLNSSKILLEGIAISDFKKISASAEKLVQLSNKAEWFVLKTPRFELHSNEFRRAAEVIAQKASDKNLDGVALAYFDLTMSCIRCHQYVREVRDARLSVPNNLAQSR